MCGVNIDPDELYREFRVDIILLQGVSTKMLEQRVKGRWQAVISKAAANEQRCTAIVWDHFKYTMRIVIQGMTTMGRRRL